MPLPSHDARGHRQLVRRELERLVRHLVGHALHLVEDAAGLHHADPRLRVSLAFAHARLRRLLRDRLVREDADPDLAAALHVAGHGHAGGLDLPRGEPHALHRLEPHVAEGERMTPRRLAAHAPLLLLAVLDLLGLEHALPRPFVLEPRAQRALAQLAFGDLALEHPALHADHAVGGLRLGEAILDVGAQRVQRHAPLAVPLPAAHLGAAQAAGALDADALRPELHRRGDRLLHGAPEGHAPLELEGHVLRHELRVELRLADLLDVDEHLARRERGQLLAQVLHLGAALADQDARPRGVDVHADLLAGPLDHHLRDARVVELLLDEAPDLHVLVELARVAPLREPVRLPAVDGPEPESVGMYFFTHRRPFSDFLDHHRDVTAAP